MGRGHNVHSQGQLLKEGKPVGDQGSYYKGCCPLIGGNECAWDTEVMEGL